MNVGKIKNISRNIIGAIFDLPIGFHKEEHRLWNRYYSSNSIISVQRSSVPYLIVMIDGKTIHNGLSDRFKGICSAYRFALNYGLVFKLNYHYPFKLSDFLVPNRYDWTINETDLIFDKKKSRPVLVNDYQIESYALRALYLKSFIKKYNQIHLYTNALFGEQKFSEDFSTLFKPSEKLQYEIDKQLSIIGCEYITISLRFQCLLGDDFLERGAKKLNLNDAQHLKEKATEQIELVHLKEPHKKVVVFSDSNIFLDYVSTLLDYVYVVPGQVVHVDNTNDADSSAYMKTFIDFFLISKASKAYLLYNDLLYKSGFPKRASEVSGIPFESIKF